MSSLSHLTTDVSSSEPSSIDPMAALEQAETATLDPMAAPLEAGSSDPMASLDAAAAAERAPPAAAAARGAASEAAAGPVDVFEAFQRARPQAAFSRSGGGEAPRHGSGLSTSRPGAGEPATAVADSGAAASKKRARSEQAEQQQREEAPASALDPLARLLVRQNRQVLVNVPRSEPTAGDGQGSREGAGVRGHSARFRMEYGSPTVVDRSRER